MDSAPQQIFVWIFIFLTVASLRECLPAFLTVPKPKRTAELSYASELTIMLTSDQQGCHRVVDFNSVCAHTC